MSEDEGRRVAAHTGRPVRGAGARSAEVPDVAVPDDHAVGRDIGRDPAPSAATRPAAGALPVDAYRTGGTTGTRPGPPGTGAPLVAGSPLPDAGDPPRGDAGDRRGGAARGDEDAGDGGEEAAR
jgi:hypothetical protein